MRQISEIDRVSVAKIEKLNVEFQETDTFKLPLRFVWGVHAMDDGNHLIPSSKGSLHLEPNLTLSSREVQQWMFDFCKQIKQQPFYQDNNVGVILPSCFIENLVDDMKKRYNFYKSPNLSTRNFIDFSLFTDVWIP